MFLGFAFRLSWSSDVFRFLVLGNVAEARALQQHKHYTDRARYICTSVSNNLSRLLTRLVIGHTVWGPHGTSILPTL